MTPHEDHRNGPRIRGAGARTRGLATIGALFFILIFSILLLGIGFFTTAHQQRANLDSKYAAALNLAEAGVNYEFSKISADPKTADQIPGATVSFPTGGSFTVKCTKLDGTGPWGPSTDPSSQYLYVVSTGTIDGVTRTIKAAAKGYEPDGQYAIYTMNSTSTWKGTSAYVKGDVGTNSLLSWGNGIGVGGIYFNGPNAGWSGTPPTGYTTLKKKSPILWPTIDSIANDTFFPGQTVPYGSGMAYVKTHNDNAKANPPIVNNSITTATTLTAGNYYVEYMNLAGSNAISFDNTAGPVHIWVGPEGGTGTAKFRGNSSSGMPLSLDPSKANYIYVGTKSGIDMGGGSGDTLMLIYAYNQDASGKEYGYASNGGSVTINGQVMANQFNTNGGIQVYYYVDLIKPIDYGYYGYNNWWQEITPGM